MYSAFERKLSSILWKAIHPYLSSPKHTQMLECPLDIGQHSTHPFFAQNFDNLSLPRSNSHDSERNNLPDLLITMIMLPRTISVVLQIRIKFFELPHLQHRSYHLLTKCNNTTEELCSLPLPLQLHLRLLSNDSPLCDFTHQKVSKVKMSLRSPMNLRGWYVCWSSSVIWGRWSERQ